MRSNRGQCQPSIEVLPEDTVSSSNTNTPQSDDDATNIQLPIMTLDYKTLSLKSQRRRLPFERRRVNSKESGYSNDYYLYGDRHHDNVFDRRDSYSRKKGSKSDKSTKHNKHSKNMSSGKGKGKGNNNFIPIVHPTEPPSQNPTTITTALPMTISPTTTQQPPPAGLPTRPRTDNPLSNEPTLSSSSNNPDGRCSPDLGGLYGSQLGFAEEYEYFYQVTTIPSVTAEELDLFVLPNVEIVLARGVLPYLFESCNNDNIMMDSTIATNDNNSVNNKEENKDSVTTTTTPPPNPALEGYVLVGDTYVYQHTTSTRRYLRPWIQQHQQHHHPPTPPLFLQTNRQIQVIMGTPPQQISGLSTQPPDRVAQGVECVNPDIPTLNCFVVRGIMTTYSREKQSEETRRFIQDAIDTTFIDFSDELEDSDNRILSVMTRDTDVYPVPEVPDVPDDDVNNGGGGDVGPPTPSPVVRPDTKDKSFGEPWQYALIAVGGCLILIMIYLCYRRPRNKGFVSSDEDDDAVYDDSSASEDENEIESSARDAEKDSLVAPKTGGFVVGSTLNALNALENQNGEEEKIQNAEETKLLDDEDGEDEEYNVDLEGKEQDYGEEEQYDDENDQSLSEHDEDEYGYEQEYEQGEDETTEDEASEGEVSEDEAMDDEGEWVQDEFEDEPTYEERLNDEEPSSGSSPQPSAAVIAAALSVPAPGREMESDQEPSFDNNDNDDTTGSFEGHDDTTASFEVKSDSPEPSPVQKSLDSSTSFSLAIARAMSQAKGEKSETEFSPFDAIHDDNIYGATMESGQGYLFRNNMNMNSSHHGDGSTASTEFEEVSVEEEELEDEEYEIEYTTESDDDDIEEFASDDEGSGGSYG